MNKTIYQDYKYSIQDAGSLYIGTKYTFGELLGEEMVPFKFRLIVERYILPEADLQDTLETHLYYLEAGSFLVQIYKQLKARIKVNVIEEKKLLFGKRKREYTTRTMTIEQLIELNAAKKEQCGMVVQELKISKLAMMSF